MDPRIIKFIKEHHVLTLATSKDNIPWTSHCFYAFLEEDNALVFTTDKNTRHGAEMEHNQLVSGGIVLETKEVGKIRGMQLSGTVRNHNNESEKRLSSRTKQAYLKRFPFAILMKTNLWILQIDSIKFTDNRLGFGKKLTWQRP
jgi:uncharacterized protein YhbP (UPF0306 family)